MICILGYIIIMGFDLNQYQFGWSSKGLDIPVVFSKDQKAVSVLKMGWHEIASKDRSWRISSPNKMYLLKAYYLLFQKCLIGFGR